MYWSSVMRTRLICPSLMSALNVLYSTIDAPCWLENSELNSSSAAAAMTMYHSEKRNWPRLGGLRRGGSSCGPPSDFGVCRNRHWPLPAGVGRPRSSGSVMVRLHPQGSDVQDRRSRQLTGPAVTG